MKKTILFWSLAVIITVASAVYQRMTGPSYPKSGSINFEGKKIDYKFERSHLSSSNYVIEIKTGDPSIRGTLKWRRNYKERDVFTEAEMNGSDVLSAELPSQAPLKKVQYYVELHKGDSKMMVPADRPIIIRFRGDVPAWILIPHIFAMFFAMLLSTRTGFEFFDQDSSKKLKSLSLWTLVIFFIGGFPLGFLMNHYAFNTIWGGIPFGNDITDNKTLIAFIGWIVAYYMIRKNAQPKLFALLAAILMILVYSIPHSV